MTDTLEQQTLENPSAGLSRLPSLTGMRFGAALLVFLCHSFVLGYFDQRTQTTLAPYAYALGWLGVEFFFILSGFVLTWSVREGQSARRFWRRRFAKVYPNHLVTWVAAILLALWAGQRIDFPALLPSLFLVHTWYPRLDVIVTVNVVTWSLSCELLFYAAFPLLYRWIRRIRPERLWWTAGALAAVVIVLPAIALLVLPGTPKLPGLNMSLTQNWFLVSFPPIRALDFSLGIVMARIVRTGRWIAVTPTAAFALLVVGFGFQVWFFPGVYNLTALVVVPLALLVPAVATADLRGTPSLFRSRPLIWLGTISYASYLTHYLVLDFGHIALGSNRSWSVPGAIGVLLAMFAVSVLVAWALHRWVEAPGMRLLSAPRSDRRARPAAVPAARTVAPAAEGPVE